VVCILAAGLGAWLSIRRGPATSISTLDENGHMLWRSTERPAAGAPAGQAAPATLEDLYREMDRALGKALAVCDPNTTVVVLSDHGIVKPGPESEALKAELRDKLQALVDPSGGRAAVRQVIEGPKQYSEPYRNDGPDLVVGCHAGYRAGWDSVTGRVKGEVFQDNRKAWSGDHCVHPDDVPGVLFSNRRLECGRPAIVDIAATALDLFGVPGCPSRPQPTACNVLFSGDFASEEL
jgi:predicted AlkP superfamily phosphohydrolase/phosphomutase